MAHYCINCPRCKHGCSICRRCACSPEELDAWLRDQVYWTPPKTGLEYLTVTPLSLQENPALIEEEEQKPETD